MFLFVALILLSFLIWRWGDSSLGWVKDYALDLFIFAGRPFSAFSSLIGNAGIIVDDLGSLPRLKRELALVKQELDLEKIKLSEAEKEITALRKASGFSQAFKLEILPVSLVGFVEKSLGGTMIINQGSDGRLRLGLPVFSEAGFFIGRIVEVASDSAKFMPITSPQSRVHVRFQQSRATGVLEGSWGTNLLVREIDKDVDIEIGEYVITSGQDALALPGLPVGRVKSKRLRDDRFFQEVELDSSLGTQFLERVFVGVYPD